MVADSFKTFFHPAAKALAAAILPAEADHVFYFCQKKLMRKKRS